MILHCNGDMNEMLAVADIVPHFSGKALSRAEMVLGFLKCIRKEAQPALFDEILRDFKELFGKDQAFS